MQRRNVIAKSWPYVTVVIAICTQGALVAAIENYVAPYWLGMPDAGPWIAWLLFVIGGYALGLIALRTVHQGEPLSDPLHRVCSWMQRRLGLAGFALNSLVMGSMGACIGLKHQGCGHLRLQGFVAALLFATLWIPLYLLVPFIR